MVMGQPDIIVRIIIDIPHSINSAESLRFITEIECADETIKRSLPVIFLLQSQSKFIVVVPRIGVLISFRKIAALPDIFFHLLNFFLWQNISLFTKCANSLLCSIVVGLDLLLNFRCELFVIF